MEPLKEWLAMAVAHIITDRRERGRAPYTATVREIRGLLHGRMEDALARMVADGRLTAHPTISDTAYEFANPLNDRTGQ